jgi:hypothetical protein
MYLVGTAPNIAGPGTGLVQRINWTTGDSIPLKGMGCGGGCGCKKCGGLGLFDSGFDPSTFGWPEWLVIGLGGYMATSMLFGAKRAAGRARAGIKFRTKRGRAKLAKVVAGK